MRKQQALTVLQGKVQQVLFYSHNGKDSNRSKKSSRLSKIAKLCFCERNGVIISSLQLSSNIVCFCENCYLRGFLKTRYDRSSQNKSSCLFLLTYSQSAQLIIICQLLTPTLSCNKLETQFFLCIVLRQPPDRCVDMS